MRRWSLGLLCVLLAAGFAGLGIWQVERRAWKLGLIAKVEARIHTAPASLPPPDRWGEDQSYRRVTAHGTFLHDRETLVQALTELGAGYWVITPLRTDAGTLLVNRGFVPPERSDPAARRGAVLQGEQTVTGLLRESEPGGGFLRSNDPAAGRWYSRDIGAIARAAKLGPVMPFFLDADATPNVGGYPTGGLTVVRFRNNHLVYALTWFGLCGLALFGAFMVFRTKQGD